MSSPFAVLGTNMFRLVDRAATGGGEIIVDGLRIPFKPGEVEKIVTRSLIEWLYMRTEQQKVWTTTGEFVQRYAVEDAPPDLIAQLGPEVGDTSLIEIDAQRLERSDTSGFVRPAKMIALNVPLTTAEARERHGVGVTGYGTRVGHVAAS